LTVLPHGSLATAHRSLPLSHRTAALHATHFFSSLLRSGHETWPCILPPKLTLPAHRAGNSRQGKNQTGLRTLTPPARRGLRDAPPVMQYLSNQTRIPATIVEYRHPVLVFSILEAQRTSVIFRYTSRTCKLLWQDPVRMAQSLLRRLRCPSEAPADFRPRAANKNIWK